MDREKRAMRAVDGQGQNVQINAGETDTGRNAQISGEGLRHRKAGREGERSTDTEHEQIGDEGGEGLN